MNNHFIAAIVLGSSKVTGIVGSKDSDGTIKVKAHIAVSSVDFISKGRVLNVDKMTSCLTSIKQHLEGVTESHIKFFYTAVGCMGLRSVANSVLMQMPSSEVVTDELIASIAVKNNEGRMADHEIIKAIPIEYQLSPAQVTLDPKGAVTSRIEARFLNIICGSKILETIHHCFRRAQIDIADGRIFVGADVLASILTTEQERSSGCAFVDMGSETTTVAVYRGKLLRHFCVIPLGGASITRDIANVFNVELDEAENLKLTHGYPDFDTISETETLQLRDGGRVKKLTELAEIIDARVEEIVQNAKAQIERSGFTRDNLVNGIMLTGGGAQLKGIDNAFKAHFKEWNFRKVKHSARLKVECSDRNFNDSGIFNVGLALIDSNMTNCYGGELNLFGNEDGETQSEGQLQEQEVHDGEKEQQSAENTADKQKKEEPEKKGPNAFSRIFGKAKKVILDIVSEKGEDER